MTQADVRFGWRTQLIDATHWQNVLAGASKPEADVLEFGCVSWSVVGGLLETKQTNSRPKLRMSDQ